MKVKIEELSQPEVLKGVQTGHIVMVNDVEYTVANVDHNLLATGILLTPDILKSEYYMAIVSHIGRTVQFEQINLA